MPVIALVFACLGVIGFVLLAFYPGEKELIRYCAISMLVIEVVTPLLLYGVVSNAGMGVFDSAFNSFIDIIYTITTFGILILLALVTYHRLTENSDY